MHHSIAMPAPLLLRRPPAQRLHSLKEQFSSHEDGMAAYLTEALHRQSPLTNEKKTPDSNRQNRHPIINPSDGAFCNNTAFPISPPFFCF